MRSVFIVTGYICYTAIYVLSMLGLLYHYVPWLHPLWFLGVGIVCAVIGPFGLWLFIDVGKWIVRWIKERKKS